MANRIVEAEASASEPTERRARSAAYIFAARVVSMGLVFVAGILTARMFDPAVRGEYAMLTNVAGMVSTFANLGFSEAIIYFFRRGDANATRTLTTIAAFNGIVSVASLMLGFVVLPWVAGTYFPSGGMLLAWLSLGAGLLTIYQRNCLAYAQARNRFLQTGLAWLIQPVLFTTALLILHWTGPDLVSVGIAFIASWGAAALVLFVPILPRVRATSLESRFVGDVFRFSMKSYANVAITQLNYRLDLFVVAALLPDLAPLAQYHIAASLAGLIWIVADSYGIVIYPRLSGYTSERERTREVVAALRYVMSAALVFAAVLFATVHVIVPLLFGEAYAQAAQLVQILLPGVLLMTVTKLLSRYLLSLNQHQWSAYASLVGVAVNVAANLVLIPRFDVVGAAWAAVLAYLATTSLACAAVLRLASFDPSDWQRYPAREIRALRSAAQGALARVRRRD